MNWTPDLPTLAYSLWEAHRKVVTSTQYEYSGHRRQRPGPHGLLIAQYTVSGTGKLEVGIRQPEVHDLPPGVGFIAVTPGPHRHWFPGGERPWEFIYLTILISELTPPFVSMIRKMGFVHRFARDSPLIHLLEHNVRLMQERGGMVDKYMRSAMAYQFLMELMRHFDPQARSPDFHPIVAKALRFIDERLASRISLGDIAQHAGVSPETITRAFRQELKTTPVRFLVSKRIEKAANRLTGTDMPIKAIACESGFATERYFCQCFHLHTGYTPGEYRANGFGELFAVEPYLTASEAP